MNCAWNHAGHTAARHASPTRLPSVGATGHSLSRDRATHTMPTSPPSRVPAVLCPAVPSVRNCGAAPRARAARQTLPPPSEKFCCFTLPGLAVLQLSQARSALKIATPLYNRGLCGKANAQVFFFFEKYWWAKCRCIRVPSKACCGSCALQRAHLRMSRLQRQTGKPLPPPTCVVSSSTYLFGRLCRLSRFGSL